MRFLIALFLLLAAPLQAAEIKLATWNIAWLTLRPAGHPDLPDDHVARAPADFARLRGYADRLDADVVAIQEIDGEEAAARIFDPARWTILLTEENDLQRPGFAIRRGLTVTRNPDLAGLDLRPRARYSLRRGADVTVQSGNARLRLLSVHLKAGCNSGSIDRPRDACEDLAEQLPLLADWATARQREGIAFAILGDFNRRLRPNDATMRMIGRGAPLLYANGGRSNPCWARGTGEGRPFIDQILLGGPARDWMAPGSLRVLVYAETDTAFRDRLSDHCPVSVELRLPG